ncbi:MAG: HEAT repeat domain-containing protein, partial [Candidatus Hydrogenedentes bacterium]|nr:HEAT repeat domain-containing protein [Candidatus Hydrogenedentota bacterium]
MTLAGNNDRGAALAHDEMRTMRAEALAEKLSESQDDIDLMAAARALAAMGPRAIDAVPVLCTVIATSDAPRIAAAAFVLSEIGAGASDRAPEVVGLLVNRLNDHHTDVRYWVLTALGRMGSPVAEVVMQVASRLEDDEESIRAAAAQALGELAENAEKASGHLLSALYDSSDEVRKAAAFALARVDPDGRKTLPMLRQALRA